MKLAIITTHAIQYNAPWFRLLAQRPHIEVKVFYTWSQSYSAPKYDPGFGKVIEWDIPLLEGYEYEFVDNVAKDPGTHHFKGIDNPTLKDKILIWGPDALLVIGWSFRSHLNIMRYFKNKIPIMFRGDSTLLNERPGIKRILRRAFLTYVYSFVDYALYVGTHNKAYYKAHGLKENELEFAPHAIDNDRFSVNDISCELEAQKWRSSIGIAEDDFVVLYAGKLEEVKNPYFILKLAAAMPDKHLHFVMVGNGPLEEALKKAAKSDERIVFLDFQNQKRMPVVYRLADVFMLCSHSETWGLAINEAMACGKPVIVADTIGCGVDLVSNNKNGIIASTEDIGNYITYIRSLMNDIGKTKAAGRLSTEKIMAYSFNAIVDSIVRVSETISQK